DGLTPYILNIIEDPQSKRDSNSIFWEKIRQDHSLQKKKKKKNQTQGEEEEKKKNIRVIDVCGSTMKTAEISLELTYWTGEDGRVEESALQQMYQKIARACCNTYCHNRIVRSQCALMSKSYKKWKITLGILPLYMDDSKLRSWIIRQAQITEKRATDSLRVRIETSSLRPSGYVQLFFRNEKNMKKAEATLQDLKQKNNVLPPNFIRVEPAQILSLVHVTLCFFFFFQFLLFNLIIINK
ncbi:hypothetical protein RFI_21528, partial [Reticulomyxa filosa]